MSRVTFRNLVIPEGVNRLSWQELRAAQAAAGPESKPKKSKGKPGANGNKFGAVPVNDPEDGYFHSTGEYKRWCDLKLLQRAGVISDLRRQVTYRLDVGDTHFGKYIADFVYVENGKEVVEDFKGHRTPEYLKSKRLMKDIHGIDIFETGPKGAKSVRPKTSAFKKKTSSKGMMP
ncbi:DUF1064 domain-containing protein [Pseudomonas aeruginosa]